MSSSEKLWERRVCIFDIDGVLLDVSKRYDIAYKTDPRKGRLFWQTFFSEDLLKYDVPLEIGIQNIFRCVNEKKKVIIISGRPKRLRKATEEQLREIGVLKEVHYQLLFLREDDDYRKSYIYKLEVLKRLAREYVIEEVHDDDENFLREIERLFPDVKLYLYDNGRAKEFRRQRLF